MKTIEIVLGELNKLASFVKEEEFQAMCDSLCAIRKEGRMVFLAGAGRSGCIVRAFANRLLHLGFRCAVVGDITTPPIGEGDLLFVLSGSGKTTSLVAMAQTASRLGAHIATVTLQEDGDVGRLSEAKIVLPGTTRLQDRAMFASVQPTGTSFEQLAWMTCDSLVYLLKGQLALSNEDLLRNHANLE